MSLETGEGKESKKPVSLTDHVPMRREEKRGSEERGGVGRENLKTTTIYPTTMIESYMTLLTCDKEGLEQVL